MPLQAAADCLNLSYYFTVVPKLSRSYCIANKSLILLLSLLFLAGKATAQKNYFYTNKPYGSEALFNPVSLLINGGFDITQLQSVSNKLGDHKYGRMSGNVWRNLTNPLKSIEVYTWKKFMRTEFLPLSFKRDELMWIPNYQQHLIGGGMLFTSMKEWYQMNGFPVPWLLSSITVMGQHYLNEVMETGPYEGWSEDEISDIYIFDIGGIILFSFDSVNEFFSEELNLADWSLQASVALPEGRVNAGQFFSIKWKLPFSEKYSFFYRYGMGALFGLSQKINETDNLSAGLGFKTKHLIDLNNDLRERTIETGWHAGIFYDRNNSLMASLVLSGIKEYMCMIDIYPGIIQYGNFSPGIWSVIGRNGNITMGVTTKYTIGIGYSNF